MGVSLKELSNEIKQFDFDSLHQGRKMDKSIAKENIVLLKNIFEKHHINYWLCFGTLLGAIRDKDFIDYDVDTDIGVNMIDLNKLEIALLDIIQSGFEIVRVTSDLSLISLLRNNEYIDIYVFRKVKDDVNVAWYCSGYIVKKDYFSKLEYIQFLGNEFFAPANHIEYLEEIYGSDWTTPKRNAHAQPINIIEETYKEYYLLLNKWLEMSLNEKTAGDVLERKGIKKIIVYGLGNIGKRLLQDLEKNDRLMIIGIMDALIEDDKYGSYNVITKEKLASISDTVIIITPFYHLNSIKEDLLSINNNLLIFGINEIIN